MLADKCGSCDHNLNVIYCNIRYLFMQLPSDIYRHTDCENVRITESDILYIQSQRVKYIKIFRLFLSLHV